jgi:hypothetical protein
MSADIRSINAIRAERDGDNTLLSPVECLEDVVSDIKTGKCPCTKVLVLTLDRGEDGESYGVRFFASKLSCSEMLALLEVSKARILSYMDVT